MFDLLNPLLSRYGLLGAVIAIAFMLIRLFIVKGYGVKIDIGPRPKA
jgi:hypothetical protein